MLKITDLTTSKDMDSKDMAGVSGGTSPFAFIDFSTGFTNKVADVSQSFGFGFGQLNEGAVTNNQAISGGNGLGVVPVSQYQDQYNDLDVSGIGKVSVK